MVDFEEEQQQLQIRPEFELKCTNRRPNRVTQVIQSSVVVTLWQFSLSFKRAFFTFYHLLYSSIYLPLLTCKIPNITLGFYNIKSIESTL